MIISSYSFQKVKYRKAVETKKEHSDLEMLFHCKLSFCNYSSMSLILRASSPAEFKSSIKLLRYEIIEITKS